MERKVKLEGENFVRDKLKEFGIERIDIKVSKVRKERLKENNYEREFWSFRNQKDRINDFDYYILVCLNEKNDIEKVFIVPIQIIGKRELISIPRKCVRKSFLKDYEGKWELIKKD